MSTPKLLLAEYDLQQTYPNVPINVTFNILDGLVQARVIDQTTNDPPAHVQGAQYIIGPTPTGAWAGKTLYIVRSTNKKWSFTAPGEGMFVYDLDTPGFFYFNGAAWVPFSGGGGGGSVISVTGINGVDVNNTDPTNPVASLNVEFTQDLVAAMMTYSGNITITYNDGAGTLSFVVKDYEGFNLGNGAEVYADTDAGATPRLHEFRSLISSDGTIDITQLADEIDFSVVAGAGRPRTRFIEAFTQRCGASSTTYTPATDTPNAEVGDWVVWVLYYQRNSSAVGSGGGRIVVPTGWKILAYEFGSWTSSQYTPYVAYKQLESADLATPQVATTNATNVISLCSFGWVFSGLHPQRPFGPVQRVSNSNQTAFNGAGTTPLFFGPQGVYDNQHRITIFSSYNTNGTDDLTHAIPVGFESVDDQVGSITGNGSSTRGYGVLGQLHYDVILQDENWFPSLGPESQYIMLAADGWSYTNLTRTDYTAPIGHVKLEATGGNARHYADFLVTLVAGEKYCVVMMVTSGGGTQDIGMALSYIDPNGDERVMAAERTGLNLIPAGYVDPNTDMESVWYPRLYSIQQSGSPSEVGGWIGIWFTAQDSGVHTIRYNSIPAAITTLADLTFTPSSDNTEECFVRHARFRSGWHAPFSVFNPDGAILEGDIGSDYMTRVSSPGYLSAMWNENGNSAPENAAFTFMLNPNWTAFPLARNKNSFQQVPDEFELSTDGLTISSPSSENPIGGNSVGYHFLDFLIYPTYEGLPTQFYFEVTALTATSSDPTIFVTNQQDLNRRQLSDATYALTYNVVANDVIGCEIDFSAGEVRWYVNGALNSTDTMVTETYPLTGVILRNQPHVIGAALGASRHQLEWNLKGPFAYTPTAGFVEADILGNENVFAGSGLVENVGVGLPIGSSGPNGEVILKTFLAGDGITIIATSTTLTFSVVINPLTELLLANIDYTNDFMMIYDASAAVLKKVRPTVFAAVVHTHTASQITDFAEATDDRVAALLVAGNNIDLTYNDGAGTLTIDVEALTSADITDFAEATDDRVAALLVAGTDITLSYNDGAGTLTVAYNGGASTGMTDVNQTSNLVITTNNVFQDTTLLLPMVAGTYSFEVFAECIVNATPDMEIRLNYTGTTTKIGVIRQGTRGTTFGTEGFAALPATYNMDVTTTYLVTYTGTIEVSTSGNFSVQARQVTSSGTSVTFSKGNRLRIKKIA